MENIDEFDIFEQYITGKLSDEEIQTFLKRLRNDSVFKKKYLLYLDIEDFLENKGIYINPDGKIIGLIPEQKPFFEFVDDYEKYVNDFATAEYKGGTFFKVKVESPVNNIFFYKKSEKLFSWRTDTKEDKDVSEMRSDLYILKNDDEKDIYKMEFKLEIFNNKEKRIISKNIKGNVFRLEKQLNEGTYYWKLIHKNNCIHFGKFYII